MHNDHKVKPLRIMLLKARASVKSDDEQTKSMYFFTKSDDLLEENNANIIYTTCL